MLPKQVLYPVTVKKLQFFVFMYISRNPLTVYISLQLKNKPDGGIAFSTFIVTGLVANRGSYKKWIFCMQ
jgi:hypothetical protein